MQQCVTRPQLNSVCSSCNLRELCLPPGISEAEVAHIESLTGPRRALKRGDFLFHSGHRFTSLFAIHTGFLKTQILHEDGREHVTGFQMAGDIVGMDAISSDVHPCDAIALEDCDICELPYAQLEALSRSLPALHRHLNKLLSREIVRDQNVMMLLGSMRAEERLAAFLLNLSERFAARGYSASQFQLRMSREEIGSYLGLKLETVSRALSHFQESGLIIVHVKSIHILDPNGLHDCLNKSR